MASAQSKMDFTVGFCKRKVKGLDMPMEKNILCPVTFCIVSTNLDLAGSRDHYSLEGFHCFLGG